MAFKYKVYRCDVCNKGVIQLSSDTSLHQKPCQVPNCPGTLYETNEGEDLPVEESDITPYESGSPPRVERWD